MSDQALLQVGVGGILAILIIREVLNFLRARPDASDRAGDASPEYWQAEARKAMTEVMVTIIVPILATQTTILTELQKNAAITNQNMAVLMDRLMQRRRGNDD